jgi:hypothetical protein
MISCTPDRFIPGGRHFREEKIFFLCSQGTMPIALYARLINVDLMLPERKLERVRTEFKWLGIILIVGFIANSLDS